MFMYCVAISAHVKVKQPNMVLELFAVMQQNGMEEKIFLPRLTSSSVDHIPARREKVMPLLPCFVLLSRHT